jgi:3',5'-cyclic-AMP phosphodiesterase
MVMITSPADERLVTDPHLEGAVAGNRLRVRAKVWANAGIQTVTAQLEGKTVSLQRIGESQVWQGELQRGDLPSGVYPLTVSVKDANGLVAEDCIHVVIGAEAWQPRPRAARDQENPLAAWPERGLLGTQLGPNKNGRKW